jgi:hypothetical protein
MLLAPWSYLYHQLAAAAVVVAAVSKTIVVRQKLTTTTISRIALIVPVAALNQVGSSRYHIAACRMHFTSQIAERLVLMV